MPTSAHCTHYHDADHVYRVQMRQDEIPLHTSWYPSVVPVKYQASVLFHLNHPWIVCVMSLARLQTCWASLDHKNGHTAFQDLPGISWMDVVIRRLSMLFNSWLAVSRAACILLGPPRVYARALRALVFSDVQSRPLTLWTIPWPRSSIFTGLKAGRSRNCRTTWAQRSVANPSEKRSLFLISHLTLWTCGWTCWYPDDELFVCGLSSRVSIVIFTKLYLLFCLFQIVYNSNYLRPYYKSCNFDLSITDNLVFK